MQDLSLQRYDALGTPAGEVAVEVARASSVDTRGLFVYVDGGPASFVNEADARKLAHALYARYLADDAEIQPLPEHEPEPELPYWDEGTPLVIAEADESPYAQPGTAVVVAQYGGPDGDGDYLVRDAEGNHFYVHARRLTPAFATAPSEHAPEPAPEPPSFARGDRAVVLPDPVYGQPPRSVADGVPAGSVVEILSEQGYPDADGDYFVSDGNGISWWIAATSLAPAPEPASEPVRDDPQVLNYGDRVHVVSAPYSSMGPVYELEIGDVVTIERGRPDEDGDIYVKLTDGTYRWIHPERVRHVA